MVPYLRKTVQLHGTLHCHVPAQVRKFHLDQLARVQGTVPVPTGVMQSVLIRSSLEIPYVIMCVCVFDPPAGTHRFGQHYSSSVDCLENALLIDSSGDLSDQNWRYPLGAQLLVDTKEVDLHHFLFP